MELIHPIDLPVDLVRDIFEWTVLYPGTAVKLALVSRQVQTWMETIIYHTIVLGLPQSRTTLFLRTVSRRPPAFFARRVRRLFMTGLIHDVQVQQILSVCTGLEDLSCWTGPTSFTSTAPSTSAFTSIRRMSIKYELLRTLLSSEYKYKLEFNNITHLEVINAQHSSPLDWEGVWYAMPRLKWLALDSREHIEWILETWEELEGLVLVARTHETVPSNSRVKLVPTFHYPKSLPAYWDGVRRGGEDFWDMNG